MRLIAIYLSISVHRAFLPISFSHRKEGEREIHEGIRGYFEASLGTLLLYRFERAQFDVRLLCVFPYMLVAHHHLSPPFLKTVCLSDKGALSNLWCRAPPAVDWYADLGVFNLTSLSLSHSQTP